MFCPLCSYLLHPQTVTGNGGEKIKIEHCGQCGGTWFDPFETIGVPFHEIVRIAADTVNPKTPSFSTTVQHCPRCTIPLSKMQSDIVPAGVAFFRCSKCRGIWTTQRSMEQTAAAISHEDHAPGSHPWTVAFIPTVAMIMLALTTIFTLGNLQQAQEARIRAAAQVDAFSLRPLTSTSILIGFHTVVPMTAKMTIISSSGYALTQDISTHPSTSHATSLANLPPQTSFRYEIELTDMAGSLSTVTGTFNTSSTK